MKKEHDLISIAISASRNARIHLSGFRVGAAILASSGKVYAGCNIEFDNYSNTIHAEEAAISAFIVAGEKKIVSIAVVTFGGEVVFPCGMCLQSLFELGGSGLEVVACYGGKHGGNCKSKTIKELLPEGFRLKKGE